MTQMVGAMRRTLAGRGIELKRTLEDGCQIAHECRERSGSIRRGCFFT